MGPTRWTAKVTELNRRMIELVRLPPLMILMVAVAGTGACGSGGRSTQPTTTVPPTVSASTPASMRTHCGVLSIEVDGRLWIADPPRGDDAQNPPQGWDENTTDGVFTIITRDRARFDANSGVSASFRLARDGEVDPAKGCE